MHAIIAIGIVIGVIIAIIVAYWIIEEYGGIILMLMFLVSFFGIAIGGTYELIHSIMIDDAGGGVLGFIAAIIGWFVVGTIVRSWFK